MFISILLNKRKKTGMKYNVHLYYIFNRDT